MTSRVTSMLASVALTLGLAGCGADSGGDGTDAGPGGASDAPASSASSAPTEAPSSTAVATGLEVTGKKVFFRLPEGVKWRVDGSPDSLGFQAGVASDPIRIIYFGNAQSSTDDLDVLARSALRQHTSALGTIRSTKVGEPREVDGVEGYTIEATGEYGVYYEWGARMPGRLAYYSFRFSDSSDSSRFRAEIDAVLASVKWK